MEYVNNYQESIDKLNQDCYDNRAYVWDRFPFPDALPRYIHKYYDTTLGNKVLDVGSGTGVLAKWLFDNGFEVLCIDPSSEMIRRCNEKGLKTVQSSIQAYKTNEKFAMIFAILSLIHVPKADFVSQINKLAAALPKGGLLFLGMLEGQNEGVFEGPDYPRFFSYYSAAEIEDKLGGLFVKKDYYYFRSGTGYMLFVFEKK